MNQLIRLCLFLFALALSLSAAADYRVFVLEITNSAADKKILIKSTLDPEQYKSIYPLAAGENIAYVDTWKCPGDTSHLKPLCSGPMKATDQTNSTITRIPSGQN